MASVEVFWRDEPEYQSERDFLARLRADLESQQLEALILTNFYLSNALQVDFLVILGSSLYQVGLVRRGGLTGGRSFR